MALTRRLQTSSLDIQDKHSFFHAAFVVASRAEIFHERALEMEISDAESFSGRKEEKIFSHSPFLI